MTRKRMVGPGGGDFAPDVSTAGGRMGGGRSPMHSAKPKSTMKTEKTKVLGKSKSTARDYLDRKDDDMQKMRGHKDIETRFLQNKGDAKRLQKGYNDMITRQLKDRSDYAKKANKVVDKKNSRELIEESKRLSLKHTAEANQRTHDEQKSISGSIKNSDRDLRDFNKQLRDKRNIPKNLEGRREHFKREGRNK
jgi:hypothetical protein